MLLSLDRFYHYQTNDTDAAGRLDRPNGLLPDVAHFPEQLIYKYQIDQHLKRTLQYFDFISFCQFKTIATCPGEQRQLPTVIGRNIYDGLLNGFRVGI